MKIYLILFIMMFISSNAQKEQASSQSLMDVIQGILDDPEFISLSNEYQLKVLMMIYDILEGHVKVRPNIMKRDVSEALKSYINKFK
jgi:hypothetical protein